jgi:hypothetical protein
MGLRIYKSGKLAGLRTGCEGSFFLPPLRTNFYSFCSDALRLLLIMSFSVCPEFGRPRTTKSAGTTKPAAFYSRVVRYSDFPKKDRCEMLPAEKKSGCLAVTAAQVFEFAHKSSAKRKCLCCGEFYPPDHRNVRHQRYCSKPACHAESKAQSQRRWQQRPQNQNYFRGPENSQRLKDWRKRNPGYWRKRNASAPVPLQEVCQEQMAPNEEVTSVKTSDALQEVFLMQPAVVVGLISMMTGHALQEDIVATARVLAYAKGATSWTAIRDPKRLALEMRTKYLLCPQRLRRVPHQFSWIDQRGKEWRVAS